MTSDRPIRASRIYGAHGELSYAAHLSRPAYTGQAAEPGTDWYLFGGRLYSPPLRRFLAPDPLSPFGRGGLNRYGYCNGDPINHVDPSGSIARPWQLRHVGGVPSSTPARASARMRPGTSLTPNLALATAAATADTWVVSATIPAASLAAPDVPASAVLGRLTYDGNAPSDVARPGSDKLDRASARKRRKVEVLHEEDYPADRITSERNGYPTLTKNWVEHTHLFNEQSTIWAADTAIADRDFPDLFETLTFHSVTHVTLYSGAHGRPSGRNWGRDSWYRPELGDFGLLAQDLEKTKQAGDALGIHVHPVDMASMNRTAMRESLSEDGVHVIGYCYGAADSEVMRAIGVSRSTVFAPWVPPPKWRRPPATP